MSAKFPRGGGEQTHSQPSVYKILVKKHDLNDFETKQIQSGLSEACKDNLKQYMIELWSTHSVVLYNFSFFEEFYISNLLTCINSYLFKRTDMV